MNLTNLEAIKIQGALLELGKRDDLPIKVSLDIAIVTNLVESRLKPYGQLFQSLAKRYSIKSQAGENGAIQFVCTANGESEEETAKLRLENLQAFAEKLNEVLGASVEEIQFKKIKLPSDIKIRPETLKALIDFVEVG